MLIQLLYRPHTLTFKFEERTHRKAAAHPVILYELSSYLKKLTLCLKEISLKWHHWRNDWIPLSPSPSLFPSPCCSRDVVISGSGLCESVSDLIQGLTAPVCCKCACHTQQITSFYGNLRLLCASNVFYDAFFEPELQSALSQHLSSFGDDCFLKCLLP